MIGSYVGVRSPGAAGPTCREAGMVLAARTPIRSAIGYCCHRRSPRKQVALTAPSFANDHLHACQHIDKLFNRICKLQKRTQALNSGSSALRQNTTLRRRLFQPQKSKQGCRQPTRCSAVNSLLPLGLDFLTFLAATVLVLPIFRSAKISPVLGFLFTGLVLGQLGLFRSLDEIEKLSELGVLFLLFEMGLELSLDRLKALAKFAFGLGGLQMLLCIVAFSAFALPAGGGIGTVLLESVFHAPNSLVSIRSVDEAVVIAAALSLSSSAFVLSLLGEKGELSSKFGSATLGILLFQDIAVVPFLVLLPLIENTTGLESKGTMSLLQALGPTALTTLGWVGILIVGGRTVLRRVFEMVAESRSDEAFFALCLLTVTGAALLTQRLGFSDTLGAFVAGVLLSETSYRTRVEADIEPFKGIFLGLFFVTTGSSFDVTLFLQYWQIVLAMVTGLLAIKILIIGLLSPLFGLNRSESTRTAFLLSQGGEFAFVLLSLANSLDILPAELNKLLIMVVVMSMALTPLLADVGKWVGDKLEDNGKSRPNFEERAASDSPIVICGFCDLGQMVANMLETAPPNVEGGVVPYVAFDLTIPRLEAAREVGFKVVYGDGSNLKVLRASGVDTPRAIVVVYRARARAVTAVRSLRTGFPDVPIYARALDLVHAAELQAAGATTVVTADTEAGLSLGSCILEDLGATNKELKVLTKLLRQETASRADFLSAQVEGASTNELALAFRVDAPKSSGVVYEDTQTPSISRAASAEEEVRSALINGAAAANGDATVEAPATALPPESAAKNERAEEAGNVAAAAAALEGGTSSTRGAP